MAKKNRKHKPLSRRDLLKGLIGFTILSGSSVLVRSLSAEAVPPEPDNLDEPTPWQTGDPAPIEATIPAQEPEQTSTEAPPSQPIDDVRPAQPGPDYVWANGYWWWNGGEYVWVTGYWAIPPESDYVYISGYWTYRGTSWYYVRGGWGRYGTRVIIVYPRPRRVVRVRVIRAPRRIPRRHYRWRHHHSRRNVYHAQPRPAPKRAPARPGNRPGGRGPRGGPRR